MLRIGTVLPTRLGGRKQGCPRAGEVRGVEGLFMEGGFLNVKEGDIQKGKVGSRAQFHKPCLLMDFIQKIYLRETSLFSPQVCLPLLWCPWASTLLLPLAQDLNSGAGEAQGLLWSPASEGFRWLWEDSSWRCGKELGMDSYKKMQLWFLNTCDWWMMGSWSSRVVP